MWELDNKKGWTLKNWYLRTMVLKKTPESPLDSKEIKAVNLKRYQPWIFIGRTDAEVEVPILWPPDMKNQLTGKHPDARKDWRQEEKVITEDEIFGWHHRLNGHQFEQTPGNGEGQRSLVCCNPRGHKESDKTSDWTTTTTEGEGTEKGPKKMFEEIIAKKFPNMEKEIVNQV